MTRRFDIYPIRFCQFDITLTMLFSTHFDTCYETSSNTMYCKDLLNVERLVQQFTNYCSSNYHFCVVPLGASDTILCSGGVVDTGLDVVNQLGGTIQVDDLFASFSILNFNFLYHRDVSTRFTNDVDEITCSDFQTCVRLDNGNEECFGYESKSLLISLLYSMGLLLISLSIGLCIFNEKLHYFAYAVMSSLVLMVACRWRFPPILNFSMEIFFMVYIVISIPFFIARSIIKNSTSDYQEVNNF